LRAAADKAGKKGVILVLENEAACNTATGAEAAEVLGAVRSPHFMLNWDPGNAAAHGENPYPDGYNLLPKDRIGHCHCKDMLRKVDGYDWQPWVEALSIGWASLRRLNATAITALLAWRLIGAAPARRKHPQ